MKELVKAKMALVRETKGAILYENVLKAPGEAVTNIYLRKSGITSPYPHVIYITVAVKEEE